MEQGEKASGSGSELSNEELQGNDISSVVQNMALAHEIVMDADFKINKAPADS